MVTPDPLPELGEGRLPGPVWEPQGSAGSQSAPQVGPASQGEALLASELRRIQVRTLRVLSGAQIVGSIGTGVAFAVGTLAARDLSGSQALSGASVTAVTLGAAVASVPLARRAGARGRRAALSLGWLIAAGGAALTFVAILLAWFPLLLAGFAIMGSATAANLQSRFAATDLARPALRARNLSTVVWATTIGSVAGPSLSEPMVQAAAGVGLPGLSGPFALSAAGFAVAGLLLLARLRPDPLLTAQALAGPARLVPGGPSGASRRALRRRPVRMGAGWSAIRASRQASIALLVVLVGQAVMVAVMAMTPVHLVSHGATLTIVGVTISVHVLGMYAFSPVFGWLADRTGTRTVMALGCALQLGAVVVTGTAGAGHLGVGLGLLLLGLGWSAGMVAGSTALAGAIDLGERPAAQGLADSLTGLAGAAAAALSGVALGLVGFAGLNAVAGVLLAPAVIALLRWHPER